MKRCEDIQGGWCCHECHEAWENWHELMILHDKSGHPWALVCCGKLWPAYWMMVGEYDAKR